MMQTDPFRDLDTLFSRLANRQSTSGGVMPMDAFRRGSDVWVHIDLPGVKTDSLDITVERNVLTIAADGTGNARKVTRPTSASATAAVSDARSSSVTGSISRTWKRTCMTVC